jgi:hypothetical protein
MNRHLTDFKTYLDSGLSTELKPVYEEAVTAQIKIDRYKQDDMVSAMAVNKVFEEGIHNIISVRDRIYQSKADIASEKMESIKKKHEVVFTDAEIARRNYELTLFTNKLNFNGIEHAEKLVRQYATGELELNIDQLYVLGNYLKQNNNSTLFISLSSQMDMKNAEEPYLNDPEYMTAAEEYNNNMREIGNPTLNFEINGSSESAILVIEMLLE